MQPKKTLFAALFILLLASSLSFAICPTAKRTVNLAAVTGENGGGVFILDVEVHPGSGTVYTAVNPKTGFSTQESEMDAVEYAFSAAGMEISECDVLFRMRGNFEGSSVDGPSAGGAMALATLAAISGKEVRQDVVMTGTVLKDGGLGEVGGIIEKSLAASSVGAKYIIVPKMKVYESFLLTTISSQNDFKALEADTLSEAAAILFSNYTEKFEPKFTPKSENEPPNLAVIAKDSETDRFSVVAKNVVNNLEAKVNGAFAGREKTPEGTILENYFADEIAKYRRLIDKGYLFTAANSAFLLSIDAEYVRVGDAQVDLDGSFAEVHHCADSLVKPEKTKENIQWAIGSDLRRIWARQKLNQTEGIRTEQGGYTTMRDLLFSYSWCGISHDLALEAATIGGERVDEASLAPLASEKLAEAEELFTSTTNVDYDAIWHLDNAYEANESGNFGASIYESTYAMTMQKIADGKEQNITSVTEKLAADGRRSLWGKIYYGQGMYLYAQAKDTGQRPADAYRILKYSSELDKVSDEILASLEKASEKRAQGIYEPEPVKITEPTDDDRILSVLLGICTAALGFAIVFRLFAKRHAPGRKD